MKKPKAASPGYLRAVRRDTEEWLRDRQRNIVRANDEAERKAREAEKAAVFAELELNKQKGATP